MDLMRNNRFVGAVVVLIAACSLVTYAAKIDPRLATVRKAYVVAVDDLGDDRPVTACVIAHLPAATPLVIVSTKDEAEIVLRVKAHLPSHGAKSVFGSMGGSPSVDMIAELPNGTKLWNEGAKLGSKFSWDSGVSTQNNQTVECALADQIIDTLRGAMRKARDK
jgi:hypothetical protein